MRNKPLRRQPTFISSLLHRLQALISIIAGFLISFIGALPLGNLNVTVMKLAKDGHITKAYQFSIGVIVVEMAYMLVCMKGVNLAASYPYAYLCLQWVMVLVLLLLGIGSFINARKPAQSFSSKNEVRQQHNGYLAGLAMSAINVLQIPYWTGWITVAYGNLWLTKSTIYFFTIAAGAGTFLSMAIFIVAGKKLALWLVKNGKLIDFLLGIIFTIVALVQVIHIVRND